MSNERAILLVGHCGPDSASLERFIARTVDNVVMTSISSTEEAETYIKELDPVLVLVNRIIPMTEERGQDCIGRMRKQFPDTPFMLISNHDDAQQAAEENGAVTGFGKRDLNSDEATQKLHDALT